MRDFRRLTYVVLSSFWITMGCQSKSFLEACPQEPFARSGKILSVIKITEGDCGDKKRPQHKYILEIVKIRDFSFAGFLFGPNEHSYLVRVPLDKKFILHAGLPEGNYVLTRIYVESLLPLGINFQIPFKITKEKLLVIGEIQAEFPCWVTYGEKASYVIKKIDPNDLTGLSDSCKTDL